MEKFSAIKIKYIVLLLIASHCVFSQNKTIVPKFGTIVFNKETIVIDEIAFNKTLKEYKPKLIKELSDQVILNQLLLHKKIDSVSYKKSIKTIEQNFMPLFEFFILENEKLEIVNVYNKDTIYSHKYENGNKISTIFFDKKTNAIYNNYNQKEITDFYNEDITEFKEFKNQRKNIKGFDCLKVSYIFTEEAEDDLCCPPIFRQ